MSPIERTAFVARRVAVSALLAVALTGCGPAGGLGPGSGAATPPSNSPAAPSTVSAPEAGAAGLEVAVVGDSITAGVAPGDDAESPGGQSWLTGADLPPLELGAGWAVPGASTGEMRDGVRRLDADVLVVMGGTNDLQRDVPWADTRDNIRAIVSTASVDRVVLAAIPPLDVLPDEVVVFNDRLRELAELEGWEFVDPWTDVALEGVYRPGATSDGVHPTQQVAFAVGRELHEALVHGATGGGPETGR
ncbi:SGNH/GDSL hydrolase family protein [Modestobacter roseus]|uniref:SGNH/GDSL hydrolase family protein n=1 Tax=Modestobacter roseus TaxID=1181884 RepID=UPI001411E7B2|nr:SGNH/GDSL hydrolase family protein [Modestobacter roseus]